MSSNPSLDELIAWRNAALVQVAAESYFQDAPLTSTGDIVEQKAEVKIGTFPFTRYGTIPGTVSFVSSDAVADEKKGLVFHARIRLDRASISVGEQQVNLSPGMAVRSEIGTGKRRLISYFLGKV